MNALHIYMIYLLDGMNILRSLCLLEYHIRITAFVSQRTHSYCDQSNQVFLLYKRQLFVDVHGGSANSSQKGRGIRFISCNGGVDRS